MRHKLVTSCCGRPIDDCPGCPQSMQLIPEAQYMSDDKRAAVVDDDQALSAIIAKIEDNTVNMSDFDHLINEHYLKEATPASAIDRVRRKVNPSNRNNRKKHDQSGHTSGLPKIAARVQPSRKRSNRTQMQHGGKQGHRRSARTQKRTMKKSFEEAVDFFKNNIGKQIDESTFNISDNKKLLIAMATKLMTQPNANRDWLMDFISRAKNV